MVVASMGKEGLAAWAKKTFDLTLIDAQMAERDGFEATAVICQAAGLTGGRTCIIAMAARAMSGNRQRHLEAGMGG
jgi:CheY-like chemotaxis protein